MNKINKNLGVLMALLERAEKIGNKELVDALAWTIYTLGRFGYIYDDSEKERG